MNQLKPSKENYIPLQPLSSPSIVMSLYTPTIALCLTQHTGFSDESIMLFRMLDSENRANFVSLELTLESV